MGKQSTFEGKTTQSLIDIRQDIAEIKELQIKQDARLTNLEKWRWLLTGSIIALGITNWPQLSKILGQLAFELGHFV